MFDAPARGDVLPVLDTRPLVKDPVDGTKRARLDVGNVSPGTTAVVTIDGDVDLRTGGSSTFQPRDAALTALSGLTIVDNAIIIGTGADAFETVVLAANVYSLLGAADYAAIRTQLGLVIGTNVQAQDATLSALAGLTIADNAIIVGTGPDAFETVVLSANAYSLLSAADYAAMRTLLSLVPGTDVQAFDAQLASLATLAYAGNALKTIRVNAGETGFELSNAGAGDVVGPATATDNAIVRYDGTTGELIQDSAVTIDDAGRMTHKSTVSATNVAADGATVTFDLSLGNFHQVTLEGNRTLALSNETTGQPFMVDLIQDGTGSRTVTWWSGITWLSGDGSVPVLPTAAGKIYSFGFRVTGSGTYNGYLLGANGF